MAIEKPETSMHKDVLRDNIDDPGLETLRKTVLNQKPSDVEKLLGVDYNPATAPVNPTKLDIPTLPGIPETETFREKHQVNPDAWILNTKEGLAMVKRDLVLSGIAATAPYYDKVFNQLSKSYDEAFIKSQAGSHAVLGKIGIPLPTPPGVDYTKEVARVYAHPDKYEDKIQAIDPDFYNAWEIVNALKLHLKAPIVAKDALKTYREQREDVPGVTPVVDGVKDYYKELKKALRNPGKNLDKVIPLVGGALAMGYLLYQTFSKENSFGARAFYGLAFLGTGYVLKETTVGIGDKKPEEVLEKVGAREKGASLKNTPWEVMYDIFPNKMEGFDSQQTLLASLNVPLKSLLALHASADRPYIDPKRFPSSFSYNERFNADLNKKRGEDLFKVAQMLQEAYKHEHPNPPEANLKEALIRPELEGARVVDLLQVLTDDIDPGKERWKLWGLKK